MQKYIKLSICLFFVAYSQVSSMEIYADDADVYRIGLTPVFLSNRTAFLEEWQNYLTQNLDKPVNFVLRQTYQEVTDLLLSGELDAAWLCGYPYTRNKKKIKILGVPLFEGKPLYKSYLIVPSSDHKTTDISDLKKKVFAFSDPDSNSGFLYPQVSLINKGIQPQYFFKRSFFTWSHRDVVKAVAEGMAHGGSVDGYVWETLVTINPELTQQTRVVSKSQEFGFPPLVVRRDISSQSEESLQKAFLKMSSDDEGKKLLKKLNINGFIPGDDRLFESISELVEIFDRNR